MERMHLVGLTVVLVAAVSLSAAYLLLAGGTTPPPTCPLELRIVELNTSYGWFYVVTDLQGEPRSLPEYTVTFFHWVNVPGADQTRVVDYQGPLPGLVGAAGNISFQDRGGVAGQLDATGDYFWTATSHNLEIVRAGRIVGGTLGCA
ncbi:MAG: hypothetical protein WC985_09875 [Thermoplasmata archaeon]